MPERAKTICRYPGCGAACNGPYCEQHLRLAPRIIQKTEPYYETASWRNFSAWTRRRNPICQRINAGTQCTNPATLTHHLISPRVAPERLLDSTNVCALCASCHPKEDTPHWVAGKDYVATSFEIHV
jgi:5-methylcytosine-specific restriction protein A